jgi:hypothetical protein
MPCFTLLCKDIAFIEVNAFEVTKLGTNQLKPQVQKLLEDVRSQKQVNIFVASAAEPSGLLIATDVPDVNIVIVGAYVDVQDAKNMILSTMDVMVSTHFTLSSIYSLT